MKITQIFIFLSLSLTAISQQTSAPAIEFLTDFEEAKDVAFAENKYIMVFLGSKGAVPSIKMRNQTFKDPESIKYYNKRYVNLDLDISKKDGRKVARKYKVEGFPALLYLNEHGEEMHRIIGYVDAKQFLFAGNRAFRNPKKQAEVFRKLYRKERGNPKYLKDYIRFAEASQDYELMDKLADQYARNVSKIDSIEWMDFVMAYSYEYNSKVFGLLKKNMNAFINLYGVEQVNEVCIDVFISDAMYNMYRPNASKLIKEVTKKLVKHKLYQYNQPLHVKLSEVILEPELSFTKIDDNVDFLAETLAFADTIEMKQLRRITSNIAMYSKEEPQLLKVKEVSESKLNEKPNVYFFDLMSIVLYKLGKKDESYKMVGEANALAQALNVSYKSGLKTMQDLGLLDD